MFKFAPGKFVELGSNTEPATIIKKAPKEGLF
jgi:hypothetical protein